VSIPYALEDSLEGVDAVHEMGDLVDDDHGRSVIGKYVEEKPQRGVPLGGRLIREQPSLWQPGERDGVAQLGQFRIG